MSPLPPPHFYLPFLYFRVRPTRSMCSTFGALGIVPPFHPFALRTSVPVAVLSWAWRLHCTARLVLVFAALLRIPKWKLF